MKDQKQNKLPPSSSVDEQSGVKNLVNGGEIMSNADADNLPIDPFEKEIREKKLPPIAIDIFYAAHGTAEDISGLKERFEKCDVYVPERALWSELSTQHFREVSQGRITPEQAILETGISDNHPMRGFVLEELKIIYKQFKPIVIADLPGDHYMGQKLFDKSEIEAARKFVPNPYASFSEILGAYRIHARRQAEWHNQREDYMLVNLPKQIERELEGRPDLLHKEKLNILMMLGAAHTRVSRVLAHHGQEVTRKFSRNPFVFDYGTEVMRSLGLGIEVDNDLAAHALLEHFFGPVIDTAAKNFTEDNAKVFHYKRKLFSMFTYEEIKQLFGMAPSEATLNFFTLLARKGIKPPSHIGDLDKMISM